MNQRKLSYNTQINEYRFGKPPDKSNVLDLPIYTSAWYI